MFWPKNIYQCVRPAFYVSKLVGLGPFSIGSNDCRSSRIDLIWSLCILTIFGTNAFIGLTVRYVIVDVFGIITEIVDLASGIFSSVNLVVCIGAGCFHRQKIMDTINELQRIGTCLEKLHASNELTSSQKNAVIYQALACFFVVTFAGFIITFEVTNEVSKQKILALFSYDVPVIVSLLVDVQFCTFVILLKQRFWMLNKIMEELETDRCGNLLFKRIWRTGKFIETIVANHNNDTITATVLKVRLLHLRLSAVAIKLNQAYSLQLLTMSVQAFVLLISYAFYKLQDLLLNANPMAVGQYFLYDTFILSYAQLQLILIVMVCSQTANEACKIGSLINDKKCYSKHSRKQVAHFSKQLRLNKVQFTACNIFAFNYGFILIVVAAGASYVIILMQFEMSRNYIKNANTTRMQIAG